MTKNKWSFDDIHIGRMKDSGNSLGTREIPRPIGLRDHDWYKFAGEIISKMNEISEPVEKFIPEKGVWYFIEDYPAPNDGTPVDLWCHLGNWYSGGYRRLTNMWRNPNVDWRTEIRDQYIEELAHHATHWLIPIDGPKKD